MVAEDLFDICSFLSCTSDIYIQICPRSAREKQSVTLVLKYIKYTADLLTDPNPADRGIMIANL